MGLVEKDFRVKCDRPLPLSYFLDGKGDRAFYDISSLSAAYSRSCPEEVMP
ncbi:hypothetical protein [Microcoleus sp. N9_A1]|uniref:hypothetical protein n=1 Tax=Microcoleus sp. N9_A1 TaxID=3055380 RepID=UPI002FD682A0